jgi:hypothetical protein
MFSLRTVITIQIVLLTLWRTRCQTKGYRQGFAQTANFKSYQQTFLVAKVCVPLWLRKLYAKGVCVDVLGFGATCELAERLIWWWKLDVLGESFP